MQVNELWYNIFNLQGSVMSHHMVKLWTIKYMKTFFKLHDTQTSHCGNQQQTKKEKEMDGNIQLKQVILTDKHYWKG